MIELECELCGAKMQARNRQRKYCDECRCALKRRRSLIDGQLSRNKEGIGQATCGFREGSYNIRKWRERVYANYAKWEKWRQDRESKTNSDESSSSSSRA